MTKFLPCASVKAIATCGGWNDEICLFFNESRFDKHKKRFVNLRTFEHLLNFFMLLILF